LFVNIVAMKVFVGRFACLLAVVPIGLVWRLGVVASVVRRMNEVTAHWARLVL